jgi:hypothetical protein
MRERHKVAAASWKAAPLLASLLLPLCAGASTIVVMQTRDTVLLGADARVIFFRASSEDGSTSTRGEMCKIVRTSRTGAAIAGILGNLDGFDSASFLRKNLSEDTTLEVSADALARNALDPLGAMIRQLELAAPDQTVIQPGRPALSVVLSRFEGGVMKVAIRDVFYSGHSAGSPEFRIQSTNCPGSCAGPNMVFASGANAAIASFLLSRFGRSQLKDPAFALKLLRLEAGAEPAIVGPPFSILEGDRNGFRWVEPGVCQIGEVTASTPARSQPPRK